MENKLKGVVLCGGQSKRMGKDKGTLVTAEKAWALVVAEKLAQQGLEVIVSVNPGQKSIYQEIFPADMPLVADQVAVHGPLNGLLSVHQAYPGSDLLLMACDLIEMDAATLKKLLQEYRDQPQYDFYVYRQEHFAEPFCAIYTAPALAKTISAIQKGTLKKYSLHERFENGNALYLDIENPAVFRNFNHPV